MSPKLILLDVFSYSCMNCLRSLEFIKMIDKKYGKDGLDTILVHPPEWEFEKNHRNIVNALENHKIPFPVIIDKNRKIIKKLKIKFWPTQVLIKNENLLYRHVGEGDYQKLEGKIANFLKIKSKRVFNEEPEYSKFPTAYCGKRKNGKVRILKDKLDFGIIYIDNKNNWIQKNEFLKSSKDSSSLTILTKGNIMKFVARSLDGKNKVVEIKLGKKLVKKITIKNPRLYSLVELNNKKQHKLTITTKPNLAVYSFSFQ